MRNFLNSILADPRSRRILLSSGGTLISKGVTAVVQLALIPIVLPYLGPEKFGVWMTLSGLLILLQLLDFGVANGLTNILASAAGKQDTPHMAKAISSAYLMLLLLAACGLGVWWLVFPLVDWRSVFSIPSTLDLAQVRQAIGLFGGLIAVGLPLSLAPRIQLALQQGVWVALWQGVTALILLLGALGVIHGDLGLTGLVLVLVGAPILSGLFHVCFLFGWQHPRLRPALRLASAHQILALCKIGAQFFLLQCMVFIAYQPDNLLLANAAGPAAVAVYAVALRFFSIGSMLVGFVLMPLWPAYGEALASGDRKWVATALRRSLLFSFGICGSTGLFLILARPLLTTVFLKGHLELPLGLMIALALWTTLESVGNAFGTMLNGLGLLRVQIPFGILFAVSCFVCKWWAVRHFGAMAMPLAATACYLLITVPLYVVTHRRLQREGVI